MPPLPVLYRPVGLFELVKISDTGMTMFPPRLAHQPIFYPVLDEAYAHEIAADWNTKDAASGYAGFVTEFNVVPAVFTKYPEHVVGARYHRELWVPAEELFAFNSFIVGPIRVIAAYAGERP